MFLRIAAILAAMLLMVLPCRAESEVEKELSEMLSTIPNDVAKLLPKDFLVSSEALPDHLDEVLESGFWGRLLQSLFYDSLKASSSALLSLFAIVLTASVLGTFKESLGSEALSGAVSLAVSSVMLSIIIKCSSAHVESVTAYTHKLSSLCAGMLPLMGTLLATGGSGSAAVATHGGFMMILGIIEAVVGQAFPAIAGTSLAFCAAGAFGSRLRLGAVARAFRRGFGIFFGAVTALLGFLISIKIGIAAAGDSVAMRASKLFASNAIPVVGAAVGDSLRTLATSLSYIKTISGSAGIVFILLLALPIFIKLWLFRSGMVLISSAAEMLGCERERELISGAVSVYGYMLAIVAITAVVFILMLTLFLKTGLAFGGAI